MTHYGYDEWRYLDNRRNEIEETLTTLKEAKDDIEKELNNMSDDDNPHANWLEYDLRRIRDRQKELERELEGIVHRMEELEKERILYS